MFSKVVFAGLVSLCLSVFPPTKAEAQYSEYQIKALFLYSFLPYAEWPPTAFNGTENSIVIGILGKDPFGDFFRPVEGKPVDHRQLVIRRFGADAPLDSLKKCNLLFIPSSFKKGTRGILKSLTGAPVITVGEADGFLESGGMVNLMVIGNNVKFEINRTAVKASGVRLRSQLLRLADRLVEIEEKTDE